MTQELEETVDQVLKIDRLCKVPLYTDKQPPSPHIMKLALAIHSRPAIQQFWELIRSRRDPNNARSRLTLSDDLRKRIEQRIRTIGASQRRSNLERLFIRLDQFHLAKEMEQAKGGRLQADPSVIAGILTQTGLSRDTFRHHQKLGNKWRTICGGRIGLLCFIFLHGQNSFGISPKSYLDLKDAELHTFQGLLDNPYINSLCTTAEIFLRSLDNSSNDVEFLWEADNKPLHELPEPDMLAYLQPFPLALGNIYDASKHRDWPRPPAWPEDSPWPADPTKIPNATECNCDLCGKEACDCIHGSYWRDRSQPRIKNYGDLGRGLQAVALEPGQAAYQVNDLIGILTGELVPAGTYEDDRTLDFVRPDLPEEPVVCQLRCAEMGNCFRLLNHSCKPSARFVQMKMSGRYVTAVKAVREIPDGAQITVHYGKDWTKQAKCLCEVCRG